MLIDSSLCPFTSGEACTVLWSTIPLLEMRAAVPLGILKFNLSITSTVFWSFLGGLIAVILSLLCLPLLLKFTERYLPTLHRFLMEKIIEKTRKEHSRKMQVVGEIFLVTFVAVPIPGSGAFTGAVLAYLFGIPFWTALFLVALGVLGSNIIMALLTVSGMGLWDIVMRFIQ